MGRRVWRVMGEGTGVDRQHLLTMLQVWHLWEARGKNWVEKPTDYSPAKKESWAGRWRAPEQRGNIRGVLCWIEIAQPCSSPWAWLLARGSLGGSLPWQDCDCESQGINWLYSSPQVLWKRDLNSRPHHMLHITVSTEQELNFHPEFFLDFSTEHHSFNFLMHPTPPAVVGLNLILWILELDLMRGGEGKTNCQVRKGKGEMQRGFKVFVGKTETAEYGHSWSICVSSKLSISLLWRTLPPFHMVLRGLSILVLYFPSHPGVLDLGWGNPLDWYTVIRGEKFSFCWNNKTVIAGARAADGGGLSCSVGGGALPNWDNQKSAEMRGE